MPLAACEQRLPLLVDEEIWGLPSGKHTKNYRKLPLLIGKSTINGYVQ